MTDRLAKAWDTLQQTVNHDLPDAVTIVSQQRDRIANISHGGGGGGGGGGQDLYAWHVPAHDRILADVVQTGRVILATGATRDIYQRDPGHVVIQSTDRPHRAPSWAWGETTSNPENCWINANEGIRKRQYTVAHEYGHTLDNRFFNAHYRLAILGRMDTHLDWAQGHYDDKYCTVPLEGFADAFERMITGGEYNDILPGFYKTTIPSGSYAWLAGVIREAMGI